MPAGKRELKIANQVFFSRFTSLTDVKMARVGRDAAA
jgi:hypothetical protein